MNVKTLVIAICAAAGIATGIITVHVFVKADPEPAPVERVIVVPDPAPKIRQWNEGDLRAIHSAELAVPHITHGHVPR